jgi:hypothetical protein
MTGCGRISPQIASIRERFAARQGATMVQTLYKIGNTQEKAARPAAALQALGFD